jgi:FkbM family methyltransferase
MKKIAANIIKGIIKRVSHRNGKTGAHDMGWLQTKILKHQEDQQVKEFRIRNLKIVYRRPYELLHAYREIFEHGIYHFSTKKADPLIIDCGANIGLGTLYFKQLYPQATVLAFEPDENNYRLLEENCRRNGLQQVQLFAAAVWTEDGTISFASKGSEASHIEEQVSGDAIRVPCVRLSGIMQKHDQIDFLKLDIEGAEYKVVMDSAAALKKVQNLFLEYHGKAEETYKLEDIFAILRQAGFQVYIKNAADALQQPFVQKKTDTPFDVQLNIFCYRNP